MRPEGEPCELENAQQVYSEHVLVHFHVRSIANVATKALSDHYFEGSGFEKRLGADVGALQNLTNGLAMSGSVSEPRLLTSFMGALGTTALFPYQDWRCEDAEGRPIPTQRAVDDGTWTGECGPRHKAELRLEWLDGWLTDRSEPQAHSLQGSSTLAALPAGFALTQPFCDAQQDRAAAEHLLQSHQVSVEHFWTLAARVSDTMLAWLRRDDDVLLTAIRLESEAAERVAGGVS